MSINLTTLSQDAGFGEAILTGMCKLSSEECYNILRSTLSLHTRDYFIGKAVVIRNIDGVLTNCLGVAQSLWCPKFLNKEG